MNEMNKLLSLSLWLSFFSLSINFLSVLLLELLMLLTLMYMKKVLVDANTLFLVTGFTQKIPESLDSIYSFNFS